MNEGEKDGHYDYVEGNPDFSMPDASCDLDDNERKHQAVMGLFILKNKDAAAFLGITEIIQWTIKYSEPGDMIKADDFEFPYKTACEILKLVGEDIEPDKTMSEKLDEELFRLMVLRKNQKEMFDIEYQVLFMAQTGGGKFRQLSVMATKILFDLLCTGSCAEESGSVHKESISERVKKVFAGITLEYSDTNNQS